jgi:hypothetical protein
MSWRCARLGFFGRRLVGPMLLSPSVAPFVPIAMLVAGAEGRGLVVRSALDALYWTNLTRAFWPLMRGLFRFPDVELERDRGANTHGLIARWRARSSRRSMESR